MIDNLVSIIIPAYNQAHFLPFAIESVLAQSYSNWECIIVDDGSTDETAQVARQYTHPAIRYLHQINQGLSAARNSGLAASRGEFISFLDADDAFFPEKLELLLTEFKQNPGLALVAGQAILIDELGNQYDHKFKEGFTGTPEQLLLENPLHVGSVLLKAEWQKKIGTFDTSLRSYEDWDYWLRLALAGARMKSITQPVSYYRFHRDQMTRNARQMTEASFQVLKKVFNHGHLPPGWKNAMDRAYSQANLRAAANAYLKQDFDMGSYYLAEGVRLQPQLIENNAELLIQKILGWTELPKTQVPFDFLEGILNHLPTEVDLIVGSVKNEILGHFLIQQAFRSFENNHMSVAKSSIRKAILYNWRWILNKGVVKILLSRKMVKNTAVESEIP